VLPPVIVEREPPPVGVDALLRMIEAAAAHRVRLPPEGAERLFHGDNEGAPGVRLDRYGPHLRLEMFEPLTVTDREPVLDGVAELLPAGGTLFLVERFASHDGAVAVRGPASDGVVDVREARARFRVELCRGRNTGLFLDSRVARRWVAELAVSGPVLNLFSYTCAFGVVAALAGAARTVNVDIAPATLERGRVNYGLNGLACPSRTFLRGDIRKRLPWLARRGERFDLIVVDPPPTAPIPAPDRLRAVLVPAGRLLWLHHGAREPVLPSGFAVREERPPDPDFPGPPSTRTFLLACQ
jgi:23S rRNA (cytosine1962-C5)-methyltransferase